MRAPALAAWLLLALTMAPAVVRAACGAPFPTPMDWFRLVGCAADMQSCNFTCVAGLKANITQLCVNDTWVPLWLDPTYHCPGANLSEPLCPTPETSSNYANRVQGGVAKFNCPSGTQYQYCMLGHWTRDYCMPDISCGSCPLSNALVTGMYEGDMCQNNQKHLYCAGGNWVERPGSNAGYPCFYPSGFADQLMLSFSTCQTDMSFPMGYSCYATCPPGYRGAYNLTCDSNGLWQPGKWLPWLNLTASDLCTPTFCPAASGMLLISTTTCAAALTSPTISTSSPQQCILSCCAMNNSLAITCLQVMPGAPAAWDMSPSLALSGLCVTNNCPVIPNNGAYRHTCATGQKPGNTCLLNCAPGTYRNPTQNPVVTCTNDSTGHITWSPIPADLCLPIQCGAFPSSDGHLWSDCDNDIGASFPPNATCNLWCPVGTYSSSPYRCQLDPRTGVPAWLPSPGSGNLSGCTGLPTCALPFLPEGRDFSCDSYYNVGHYTYGTVCVASCGVGYYSPSLAVQCMQSTSNSPIGAWNDTLPVCNVAYCSESAMYGLVGSNPYVQPYITFSTPVYLDTGLHTVGTEAYVDCMPPYFVLGSSTGHAVFATCIQATGEIPYWSIQAASVCVFGSCPSLPDTAVYTSSCAGSSTIPGGTICELTCKDSYSGAPTTAACLYSPTGPPMMLGAFPTCVPRNCSAQTGLAAVQRTSNCGPSTLVGARCHAFCVAGLTGYVFPMDCLLPYDAPFTPYWSVTPTLLPPCVPATCPAINTTLPNDCGTGTVAIGTQCRLMCPPLSFGMARKVTCVQAQLSAPAQWQGNTSSAGMVCQMCVSMPEHCLSITSCDPQSGAVTQCGACAAGFYGPTCSQACPSTTPSCFKVLACHQTTGQPTNCSSCIPNQLCRAATQDCDVPEYCTPAGVCPPNVLAAPGAECSRADMRCQSGMTCSATGVCQGGTPTGCCPNGAVDAGEGCDDGNGGGNDGCSSTCQLEPGWSCPTPGQACVQCASGVVADCNQECGGTAYFDSCGVCVGGSTERVANGTRDVCGRCGGENLELDDCGVCSGNNRNKDPCGLCFGNGATCKGCDGVPNSGKVPDVCGICGGDNSTCVGCDGVPIPLGGKRFDPCGICGGASKLPCVFDCRGSTGTAQWDCNNVCGGGAVINACGVCVGGTTGLSLTAGMCGSGGGCAYNSTCACPSGVYDDCGVCDGDNMSCKQCDDSLADPGSRTVPFTCGQCWVMGIMVVEPGCNLGCDGVQDSGKTYDCNHDCGGAAVVDSCGVCVGGLTGVAPEIHRDACGICFGGNRSLDLCGVCGGKNKDRDQCGICFGNNEHRDDCGVCFGRDRSVDVCGRCDGNGTWCLGCDSVPFSNLTRDACGVCGGTGVCPTPGNLLIGNLTEEQSNALILRTSSLTLGSLFLVAIIIGLVYWRRRRAKIGAYLVATEKSALANAPSGEATFMVTDIQGSTALWEQYPEAMAIALDAHNEIIRNLVSKYNGYEYKCEGDSFKIAFKDAGDAVVVAAELQTELLSAECPEELLKSRDACVEYGMMSATGTPQLLRRGLRVRVGLGSGIGRIVYDQRTRRAEYFGQAVREAVAIQNVAAGGQVFMDEATYLKAALLLDAPDSPYVVTPMGTHLVKGCPNSITMYQLDTKQLKNRAFPSLRSAANVLVADTQRTQTTNASQRTASGFASIRSLISVEMHSGTRSLTSVRSSNFTARNSVDPFDSARGSNAAMSPGRDSARSSASMPGLGAHAAWSARKAPPRMGSNGVIVGPPTSSRSESAVPKDARSMPVMVPSAVTTTTPAAPAPTPSFASPAATPHMSPRSPTTLHSTPEGSDENDTVRDAAARDAVVRQAVVPDDRATPPAEHPTPGVTPDRVTPDRVTPDLHVLPGAVPETSPR